LRRLLAEGHELGSHAAIHLQLSQLPTAEAQKQIEWAVGNITAVTGEKSVPVKGLCWFRLLLVLAFSRHTLLA
jgi:peptidoglycan/xylan/chitin deacetylase (PgdA/CDA1 family)